MGCPLRSLRIPPDQYLAPDRPFLLQQAEMAGWWAGYGRRWARSRWKLRGMQGVGEFPNVGGQPHIETTDCTVGDRFKIWSEHRLTLIAGSGRIRIGNDVFINGGAILFSMKELVIEDAVAISNEVYICDSNSHGMEGRDVYEAPVRIGRGSWVGARAMILPGVTIGPRVMVAAGAVVSRDVPADSLVAGNPGRVVRTLHYPDGCLRAWHDIFCRCPLKDLVNARAAGAAQPCGEASFVGGPY
ncbi:MAG TPA: acyltransferase [Frankiaceae bacterium]|nr:acyltransferase [Frankiaceae bacterium]